MLNQHERDELLQVARDSIDASLHAGHRAQWRERSLDGALREPRASFVTLHIEDRLRGCCGSLIAHRPLGEDVWHNASASAFCDPRFAPLMPHERALLQLHLSVLEPPEPMAVTSERDLLDALRPGVDGLIIELGEHRATFLPDVWQQLSDPEQFVQQLKMKAGLPREYWSPDMRVSRYRTESFGDNEAV